VALLLFDRLFTLVLPLCFFLAQWHTPTFCRERALAKPVSWLFEGSMAVVHFAFTVYFLIWNYCLESWKKVGVVVYCFGTFWWLWPSTFYLWNYILRTYSCSCTSSMPQYSTLCTDVHTWKNK
jgi:hypothetical protein